MRITVIGSTYLLKHNRSKFNDLPSNIRCTFIVPTEVKHSLAGAYHVETDGPHDIMPIPARFTDRLSIFYYQVGPLFRAIESSRPDLIQIDHEPCTLAMAQVTWYANRHRIPVLFFTWENIIERYRIPFQQVYRFNLNRSAGALAGNRAAEAILRRHRFKGPIRVLPQLGIDPTLFKPETQALRRAGLGLHQFTIGFVGRLTEQKGLLDLFHALSALNNDRWQLLILGRGAFKQTLVDVAEEAGFSNRIIWADTVPHDQVPIYLQMMDLLVLPSRTTPHWAEQFGHVLIEAMACGVATLGSDSGAIPEVIGNAGRVFKEGDIGALTESIRSILSNPKSAHELGKRGRERVLSYYTDTAIRDQTILFWRDILSQGKST